MRYVGPQYPFVQITIGPPVPNPDPERADPVTFYIPDPDNNSVADLDQHYRDLADYLATTEPVTTYWPTGAPTITIARYGEPRTITPNP